MYLSSKPIITITTLLSTLTTTGLAACPPSPQTSPTNPYPNHNQISQIFQNLETGNFTAFLARVAPNVSWTLMGTHPLAGQYHNRTIFAIDALQHLSNTLDPARPTALKLTQIVGGGDSEWSVQELHGLVYDNKFAWVTRWNAAGLIAEARAYLDSALVNRAITENESGEYTYTDQRLKLKSGPEGSNCKADA